jgi:hypothetical protein
MEQTPQQVIVDLDTLTNALSVLLAVGGRRTSLLPSQPMSPSTLRTPALTRMTPRERHLQQRVEGSCQGEDEASNFTREARESSEVSTGVQLRMENQREAEEDLVPRTAARRNVTSRCSREGDKKALAGTRGSKLQRKREVDPVIRNTFGRVLGFGSKSEARLFLDLLC